ncbi:MAG: hypothetical protein C0606_10215 [Hyphomicrobiales bacterium]|nr:MAG: hypothetical protein C0606_10215 [Hyphomicrobiales bacterium]
MLDFTLARFVVSFVSANLRFVVLLVAPLFVLALIRTHFAAKNAAVIAFAPDGMSAVSSVSGTEFVILLIEAVLWLGAATAWHRLILLREEPSVGSLVPGKREFRYFLVSLMLFLLLALIVLPVAILVSVITLTSGSVFLVLLVSVAMMPLATYFALRFSPVLPRAALELPWLGFKDAWRKTRPYSNAILGWIVVVFAVSVALQLISLVFGRSLPFGAYGTAMLGAVILTPINYFLLFADLTVMSELFRVSANDGEDADRDGGDVPA